MIRCYLSASGSISIMKAKKNQRYSSVDCLIAVKGAVVGPNASHLEQMRGKGKISPLKGQRAGKLT